MNEPLAAPPPRRLRVLIADDERLMREQIRTLLLQTDPNIEIVAEARDGEEAVEAFRDRCPEVAFLDIRMPRLDGIQAARQITAHGETARCEIVFVTAYDHHAIEAFEQGAIDYLLKPASADRLQRTLERIRKRLGSPNPEQVPQNSSSPETIHTLLNRLENLLKSPARSRHLETLHAAIGNSIELIPVDDVLFFTSDEKYTRVRTARTEALLRKSLRELLDELDPDRFWQVHRSSIVNLRAISKIHRDADGRLQIAFEGLSERIEVSRSFSARFKSM